MQQTPAHQHQQYQGREQQQAHQHTDFTQIAGVLDLIADKQLFEQQLGLLRHQGDLLLQTRAQLQEHDPTAHHQTGANAAAAVAAPAAAAAAGGGGPCAPCNASAQVQEPPAGSRKRSRGSAWQPAPTDLEDLLLGPLAAADHSRSGQPRPLKRLAVQPQQPQSIQQVLLPPRQQQVPAPPQPASPARLSHPAEASSPPCSAAHGMGLPQAAAAGAGAQPVSAKAAGGATCDQASDDELLRTLVHDSNTASSPPLRPAAARRAAAAQAAAAAAGGGNRFACSDSDEDLLRSLETHPDPQWAAAHTHAAAAPAPAATKAGSAAAAAAEGVTERQALGPGRAVTAGGWRFSGAQPDSDDELLQALSSGPGEVAAAATAAARAGIQTEAMQSAVTAAAAASRSSAPQRQAAAADAVSDDGDLLQALAAEVPSPPHASCRPSRVAAAPAAAGKAAQVGHLRPAVPGVQAGGMAAEVEEAAAVAEPTAAAGSTAGPGIGPETNTIGAAAAAASTDRLAAVGGQGRPEEAQHSKMAAAAAAAAPTAAQAKAHGRSVVLAVPARTDIAGLAKRRKLALKQAAAKVAPKGQQQQAGDSVTAAAMTAPAAAAAVTEMTTSWWMAQQEQADSAGIPASFAAEAAGHSAPADGVAGRQPVTPTEHSAASYPNNSSNMLPEPGSGAPAAVGAAAGAAAAVGAQEDAAGAEEGGALLVQLRKTYAWQRLSQDARAAAQAALLAAAAEADASCTCDKHASDGTEPEGPAGQQGQHVAADAAAVCELVQLFCPELAHVAALTPDVAGFMFNPAVQPDHPPRWPQDAGLQDPAQLLTRSGLGAACAPLVHRVLRSKLLSEAAAAAPRPCRNEEGTGLLPFFWSAHQMLLQHLATDVLHGPRQQESPGEKLKHHVLSRVQLTGLVTAAFQLLQQEGGMHPQAAPAAGAANRAYKPGAAAGGRAPLRIVAQPQEYYQQHYWHQRQQQQQQQGQEERFTGIADERLSPAALAAAEAALQSAATAADQEAAAVAAAGWPPRTVTQPGPHEGLEVVADAALARGLVQLFCPAVSAAAALRKDTAGPLHHLAIEPDDPPRYSAHNKGPLEPAQLLTRSGLKVACMPVLPNNVRLRLQEYAAAAAEGPVPPPAHAAAAHGSDDSVASAAAGAGTGLMVWFWSAHELLLQELASDVWRSPNDTASHGERLQKVVRGRVQLAQVVVMAYNLLVRGDPSQLAAAGVATAAAAAADDGLAVQSQNQPAGAAAVPADGVVGAALPTEGAAVHASQQGFSSSSIADAGTAAAGLAGLEFSSAGASSPWGIPHHALSEGARAAAEAALEAAAEALDRKAAAVAAAGWSAPIVAVGQTGAYPGNEYVADAALAYSLVQLFCPAVCAAAALRWDTAGPLHNLAVALDDPPRWQEQQGQPVKAAQLLTRSGLLAACAGLVPDVVRVRLQELATAAAPSYDGCSWGTGLQPFFWSAHELLLLELGCFVWKRHGDACSPGDRLRALVKGRVQLTELIIMTYNLLLHGRLTEQETQEALGQLAQLAAASADAEPQDGADASTPAAAGAAGEGSPAPAAAAAAVATAATTAAGVGVGGDGSASAKPSTMAAAGDGESTEAVGAQQQVPVIAAEQEQHQHKHHDTSQETAAGEAAPAVGPAADADHATAMAAASGATPDAAIPPHKQQEQRGGHQQLSSAAVAAAEAALQPAVRAAVAATKARPEQHGQTQTSSGTIRGQMLITDAAAALRLVLMFCPDLLSAPALQPGAAQLLPNVAVERDEPPKFLWSWYEWYEVPQEQLCCASGLKLCCLDIEPKTLRKTLLSMVDAAADAADGSRVGTGLLPWFLSARDRLLQELQSGVWKLYGDHRPDSEVVRLGVLGRVQLARVVMSVFDVLQQARQQLLLEQGQEEPEGGPAAAVGVMEQACEGAADSCQAKHAGQAASVLAALPASVAHTAAAVDGSSSLQKFPADGPDASSPAQEQ